MSTDPRSSLGLADLVRARIMARGEAGDFTVEQVVSLLQLTGARRTLPRTPVVGAMVVSDEFSAPLDEDDDEIVVQRHTSTVAVLLCVSAANDPGGKTGATEDRLTPLLTGVRRVLLGWPPEGERFGRGTVMMDAVFRRLTGPTPAERAVERWSPLVLVRGRLEAIDDGSGRVWWRDEYRTSRLVRGVEPDPCPDYRFEELCVSLQGGDPEPLARED